MVPSAAAVSGSSGAGLGAAASPGNEALVGFGVALGDAARELRTAEPDARLPLRDEPARDPRGGAAPGFSEPTSASGEALAASSLLGVLDVSQTAGAMAAASFAAPGVLALRARALPGRPLADGANPASDRFDASVGSLSPTGAEAPFLDGEGRVGAALVGRDDVRVTVRAYGDYAGLVSGKVGEVDLHGVVGVAHKNTTGGVMSELPSAPDVVAVSGGGLVAAAMQGLERAARGRAQGVRTDGVVAPPAVNEDEGEVGGFGNETVVAPVDARASASDVASSDSSGAEREPEVVLPEGVREDVAVAPAPGRGRASLAPEAGPGVVTADPSARQERVDRALDAVTLPSRLELDVSDRDGVWSLEVGRHHAGLEVLLRGDREFVGAVRGVEQELRESLRSTGEVARVAVSVDTSAGRGGDTARDQGRGGAWAQAEASSSPRPGRASPSREAGAPSVTDAARGGVTVSRLA